MLSTMPSLLVRHDGGWHQFLLECWVSLTLRLSLAPFEFSWRQLEVQCQYVTSIGSAMVSSGSETRTKEAHKQTKKKNRVKEDPE